MTVIVQQPYNLFAQQKMAGYPSYQDTQKRVPGQVQGETPEQFAAGKQAANSQTGAVSVPVVEQTPAPVVQNTKPQPSGNTKVVTAPMDANSPTAGMDYLNSLYTSPQEEERLRKANVMNQRILAIGDAIRHIGNIANTVNWAPAQQFNSPVQEEQARYEKGKAFRDRANQQYYTYQQQKAAQDAAQRKWEQQFQLNAANAASQHAYRQYQARIAAERAANQKAYQEGSLALRDRLGTANQKERERHNKVAERQGQQRIGIASRNATNMENYRRWKMNGGGAGGSGVAPLDTPKGQITPNGRSYSNQLLQMFDYAKSKGYVKESDVARRLRELGFGKDQSDNVKRQMVMDLLRTNQDMGDYASSRLGWSYGAGVGGGMDLGLDDDEEDEMDLGLD